MAGSDHISRRDFIKLTTAAVGTFIGAVVGLPAIAYLIDPALKSVKVRRLDPVGETGNFRGWETNAGVFYTQQGQWVGKNCQQSWRFCNKKIGYKFPGTLE